jgi:hypothetical protein
MIGIASTYRGFEFIAKQCFGHELKFFKKQIKINFKVKNIYICV